MEAGMFRSLSPAAIGVKVSNLAEGLDLAARHGFEGYHFSIVEAAGLGAGRVGELVEARGMRLSAFGLPVDYRGDEAAWKRDLHALPRLARVAAGLGVRRTSTWLMPCSDELAYEENFAFHLQRLGPVAAILADYGIELGLEYVAPRTFREGRRFAFVHNMQQMAGLCRAVGPNAGFLLDCWHWYNAGETVEDLLRLGPGQVVDVHVSDAPAGLPREAQVDHVRSLPGETGVIDCARFLSALAEIGYDGPVMAEPFSEEVRRLSAEEACAVAAAALDKVWKEAGL